MKTSRSTVFAILLGFLIGTTQASEESHYAGQETREIKALSQSQISDLLSGKGMGYGKTAELNGYPGPAHVLELAEGLSLTAAQREETEAVFARMQTSAKALGAELVAAEHALDQAFRDKLIDESSLAELVKVIGDVESRLRAVHLNAHLQQTEILDDHQMATYMTLRGYHRGRHGRHH